MHDMFLPNSGNGNGNKMNLRLEMLGEMLTTAQGELGSRNTSAKINSLRQAIRRNKSDMADNTTKSLDVLRQVFQGEINAEIQQIIDRHLRTTFTPAFENLKRNGYEVTDADINELCIDILEGAKESYLPNQQPPSSTLCIPSYAVLKNSTTPATQAQNEALAKLYESDDYESETGSMVSRESSVVSSRLSSSYGGGSGGGGKKRGRPRKTDVDSGRSGTPLLQGSRPISAAEAVKWSPDRLEPGREVRFILASKVNKALGSGSRAHIFGRYPLAFRYIADEEDRAWLLERGLTTRLSGKIFVMFLEDVLEIAGSEGTSLLTKSALHQFSFLLPDASVQKIRQRMLAGYSALRSRVLANLPTTQPFDPNNPYPTFTI